MYSATFIKQSNSLFARALRTWSVCVSSLSQAIQVYWGHGLFVYLLCHKLVQQHGLFVYLLCHKLSTCTEDMVCLCIFSVTSYPSVLRTWFVCVSSLSQAIQVYWGHGLFVYLLCHKLSKCTEDMVCLCIFSVTSYPSVLRTWFVCVSSLSQAIQVYWGHGLFVYLLCHKLSKCTEDMVCLCIFSVTSYPSVLRTWFVCVSSLSQAIQVYWGHGLFVYLLCHKLSKCTEDMVCLCIFSVTSYPSVLRTWFVCVSSLSKWNSTRCDGASVDCHIQKLGPENKFMT